MEEGTPIDALENGDISNKADEARMKEILRDMNASVEQPAPMQPQVSMPPMQQQPPPSYYMQQQPPMQPQYQHPPPRPHYVQVDDEYAPRKKNAWSNALDMIRDPIVVGILVFVLSLPVFHTFAGKYASWAFAIGGQFSWLGLLALSGLAGLLFGLYKALVNMIGL